MVSLMIGVIVLLFLAAILYIFNIIMFKSKELNNTGTHEKRRGL